MIVGTWKRLSGAMLRLKPDGTFAAQGLPPSVGESSTLNIPPSGQGRWHVGPVPAEPSGVVFDFSRTVQMGFLAERIGSTSVLVYDKGDPDEGVSGQYQFKGCSPVPPRPSPLTPCCGSAWPWFLAA